MKFSDPKMQVLLDIAIYASYVNGYHAGNNEHLQNEQDNCVQTFISYVEEKLKEK